MKLTKRKALEICIELWTWLAKTGAVCKSMWPGWEKHEKMYEYCPCCEYSEQRKYHYSHCEDKCLIKWKAGHCNNPKSEFFLWRYSITRKTRKKRAKQIADLAREALARLPNRKKK